MFELFQNDECIVDGLMARLVVEIRDHPDATGVVFILGVVYRLHASFLFAGTTLAQRLYLTAVWTSRQRLH